MLPLLLSAVTPDCLDGGATSADVAAAVHTALDAFEVAIDEVETAAALRHVRQARALVACLREPIAPADAALLHFAGGVAAFAETGLSSAALPSLLAMRAASPDLAPPAGLVRPGTPMELALQGVATADPLPWVSWSAPRGVVWLRDGADAADGVTLPAVLQARNCWTGDVLRAAWVGSVAGLPDWSDLHPRRHANAAERAWTGVAIAAGILAGGAWGAAIGTHEAWDADQGSASLWDANHATYGLGVGLSAVALGAGAGALASRDRCR